MRVAWRPLVDWLMAGALAAGATQVQAAEALDPPGSAAPAPTAPQRYEFGRGLPLGDSGFTLGGYFTGEYHRWQQAPSQWRASHASVFLWWEGLGRVKVFAEADLENLLARRRDADGDGDNDRRVSLERLYLDYVFSDQATVRVGKFLTPIGRWNLMHADPLVWTTTRPLLTQSVFPHGVTGAMVSGELSLRGQSLAYSVYGSNGSAWHADEREDPFARVLGARAVLSLGSQWRIGASLADYEQRSSRGQTQSLVGVDAVWSRDRWELSAEWQRNSAGDGRPWVEPLRVQQPALRRASTDYGTPGSPPSGRPGAGSRGAYVQGVAPLAATLYLVARYERARDPRADYANEQGVLGLVWRPNPATSVKGELVRSRQVMGAWPRGVVASVCVLF